MTKRAAANAPKKFDAYNTAERARAARARIEQCEYRDESGQVVWTIPADASTAILGYIDWRANDRDRPLSEGRVLLYYYHLPRLAVALGSDFLEPTEQATSKFSAAFGDLAGTSRKTYRDILTAFWSRRFEQAGKDLPGYLRMPISKKALATKSEDDLLSDDEQARIAAATVCDRDEAFVKVLSESGARISELLGLDLRHVTRNEHGGFLLHVDGKTGRRPIPLFGVSVPALSKWLTKHPMKDTPNAPLFCGVQAGARLGTRMTYGGVMSVLITAARRAGVDKSVHPHLWRHSRATAVAKDPNIPTAIMNQYFGWSPASRVAAAYIHTTGRDVERAFAESLGVAKVEQRAPASVLPKACPRCEFSNDPTSLFCGRCASSLDLKEFERDETTERVLGALLAKPNVREFLARELAKAPLAT